MRTRVLLALALLACRPVTVPPGLPAVPVRVTTPAGPVTVTLVPSLHADGEKVWGEWDWGARTIRIELLASRRTQWLVYFHELCHVAMDDSGQAYGLSEAKQDGICDAMAVARFRERFG